MAKLNVFGEFKATGFDLPAGQSQPWVGTGWSRGMGVWVFAWPVGVPGTWFRSLEVRKLSLEPNGNFTFEVHNNGTTQFAHYGIFVVWTDVIT